MPTTSGGYSFLPTIAEVITEAYERCGIAPAKLSIEHISSALRSLNLLFVELENAAGDMLYRQDRVQETLFEGSRGFLLPPGTLAVTNAVIARATGDLIRRATMTLMAPDDWERLSQQEAPGFPTQYWIARGQPGETSTIDAAVEAGPAPAWGPGTVLDGYASDQLVFVLWPHADQDGDVVTYTRIRQIQDAETIAQAPDVTRQWLETLHAGLAAKLAAKWSPERVKSLTAIYATSFTMSQEAARDRSPIVFGARMIGSPARRRRT